MVKAYVIQPGCVGVALIALCAKLALVYVVLLVTVNTARRCVFSFLTKAMAAFTTRGFMRTAEGEIGVGIVVELYFAPAIDHVA